MCADPTNLLTISPPNHPPYPTDTHCVSSPTNMTAVDEPSALAVEQLPPHLRALKWQIIGRIAADHAELLERRRHAEPSAQTEIQLRIDEECHSALASLPEEAQAILQREVKDELLGFGPIQKLLDDTSVSEVMVNRADRVYVERKGKSVLTDVKFEDDAHIRRIIERIIVPLGRHIDENNPLVDARLPDGSRVNIVIPPVSVTGSCITIRKFGTGMLAASDLVRLGAFPQPIADFLQACVVARLNIVVAGGTGSGKTTLLNVLSSFIPKEERIVTIEDAAELKLHQDHVITLEAKKANREGKGEVTTRELVRNALRMRPERIVVGEVRGGDALDMLQAMNTGHDGSLTTLHANTPRDVISRIETMALMGGIDFPIKVVREQIASAIQLLIQQSRLRDGSRRITYITEIGGMEGDKVVLQEIFRFEEEGSGLGPDGRLAGRLKACGLRPRFMHKLEGAGFKLPNELFMPGNGVRK
jgi:pilus assembly protein CpaF